MILENITQREDAYIRQVVSDLYGVSPISWQYVGKNILVTGGQPVTGIGGQPASVKWRINYNVDPSTFVQTSIIYWSHKGGNLNPISVGYTDFYSWITTGGKISWENGLQKIYMTPKFTNLTSWYINFELVSLSGNYNYGTINQKVGGSMTPITNSGNMLYDDINKLYLGKITKNSSISGIGYAPFTSLVDKMKSYVSLSHYASERYNENGFNLVLANQGGGDIPKFVWFNGYEIEIPKLGQLPYTTSQEAATVTLQTTLP